MSLGFGSSGIRGPYGDPISAGSALSVGRALSILGDEAVLARDARTTGPLLSRAVAAGLASSGVDVRDLGVQPTPVTGFAARQADLGVHVTASHNPPTDNGIKVFGPDGASLGPSGQARVEDAISDLPERGSWQEFGGVRQDPTAADAHRDAILDRVPAAGIDVALDGGNGPGGPCTAELLAEQGCRVTSIHAAPDGRFPGRPSEPTPDQLGALRDLVRRRDLDLGIAHDGDADRCVAVTGAGRVLSGDELLLAFAKHLQPDRIVVPVNATMALRDAAPDAEIVRTRVGDAYVSAELADGGGDLGGEPSGSWIFPSVSLCPDGPHAACRLAALVDEVGDLEAWVPDPLPMHRVSHPCPEDAKTGVVEAFAEEVEGSGEILRVDGVRVDRDDGWILVRPSGTEPKVRMTVEARDEAIADKLRRSYEDVLERCLP